MIRPDPLYPTGRTQEVLVALRGLLSRNPSAAHFGAESLSELLYQERFLSYRADPAELEPAIEALRVEGEVLG